MAFSDLVKNAIDDIWEHLGESATYNGATACTVIIDKDVVNQPDLYQAQAWDRVTILRCIFDEVGEPDQGDTFLVGATTYTVRSVEENDGYAVYCIVTS